ncbi:MAG: FAD-dependent oxidoreductase, partial [Thermomicrobiales bacterium]
MISTPVVIVGAGMAGLTCAVALREAGITSVVLESSSTIGGRVNTSVSADGFVVDRGFQVLLTASPAVERWIDRRALNARAFGSGAQVWTGRRLIPVVDPLRHPAGLLRDVTSPVATAGDKVRFAREVGRTRLATWESANAAARSLGNDRSIVEYLWTQGFSERFVNRLSRPFWGGITLDPLLSSSAGLFLSSLGLFARGLAVLPRGGMVAMPRQLADRLPADSISLETPVSSVVIEDGRASGVQSDRGLIAAEAVVIATDPTAAEGLLETTLGTVARDGRPCVTAYLAGPRRPKSGPFLLLDGSRSLTVNHVVPLSEVQPSYAPVG